MDHYCHVKNDVIDIGPQPLPEYWRDTQGGHIPGFNKGLGWGVPDAVQRAYFKSFGWLPVVYLPDPPDPFDPATQVRTGPTGCNVGDAVPPGADDVTGTYAVRAKTQQELDDYQRNQDIVDLRNAVVDMAIVMTEDVAWRLANTAMQPSDFTPNTKQRYLRIKALADRVK